MVSQSLSCSELKVIYTTKLLVSAHANHSNAEHAKLYELWKGYLLPLTETLDGLEQVPLEQLLFGNFTLEL
jgi:hypothetical protein